MNTNSTLKSVILLLLGIFLLVLSCQMKNSDHTPAAVYTKADSTAYSNYTNYCAGCHGGNLEEFTGIRFRYVNSEQDMSAFIRQGQSDIGMPAFEKAFTQNEIDDLASFIIKINNGRLLPPEVESAKDKPVKKANYYIETVVAGLNIPWGIEFLPDGDMLIAEKAGILYRYSPGKELTEISGLPEIWQNGQGGLLDLKLHPAYAENGWIYIAYCYRSEKNKNTGNTAIMRAKLRGNELADQQILYKGIPATSRGHHFGCRIEFDRSGYMFFSIGDRGDQDNAQLITNSNGKIHRLTDDGKIPPDNPFVGKPGAQESIFSFGHRNPQGMAIDPVTGDIWEHEHGPRGGDELNIIQKGKNYGWPVITFGINYDGTIISGDTSREGMEQPLRYYIPSIAPSGMAFVTGNRYPGWENSLLSGSLRFNYVERCTIENGRVVSSERIFEDIGRVRTIKMSPDGFIYLTVENPGRVLKVVPNQNAPE